MSDPNPDRTLLDWPDDILTKSPWGFQLENIAVSIDIWERGVKLNVSINQDPYQNEKIPESHLKEILLQAQLHLFNRCKEILAELVSFGIGLTRSQPRV